MLVIVLAVSGVTAPIVDVVDVISVWDRNVATPLAVNVVMRLMHRVTGWFAFVVVILVLSVKVTVVHVVDVIPVRDCDVTASFAVDMIVLEVLVVDCARHRFLTAVPDWFVFSVARRTYSLTASAARESAQLRDVHMVADQGSQRCSQPATLNCFDWRSLPCDAC